MSDCLDIVRPEGFAGDGYLKLIETWGSDERVIEAARMSTQKGFLGWGPVHTDQCDLNTKDPKAYVSVGCTCKPAAGDERLLKYLYENAHNTPFEFGGMVIEVQAPIFVFREWHRHRTQSYNEMSARYAPLPDMNYVPTVERLMLNSKSNKQAGTVQGANELTDGAAQEFQKKLEDLYLQDEQFYQWSLHSGVPKELARLALPVGRYSRMRASANLRNWLAFLTLRMAPNAQWEIRQYANAVGQLVAQAFPRTWELFVEPPRMLRWVRAEEASLDGVFVIADEDNGYWLMARDGGEWECLEVGSGRYPDQIVYVYEIPQSPERGPR